MRLIDADALIKSMKSYTVKDNGLTDDYKAGLTDSIRTAVALAENEPTIDAVPVVRGEWVLLDGDYFDYYKCKACGLNVSEQQGMKWSYCPSCGAKMEDKP